MSFGDLAAQNQSNPDPPGLVVKKGTNRFDVLEGPAIIDNPNIQVSAFPRPPHLNAAAGSRVASAAFRTS